MSTFAVSDTSVTDVPLVVVVPELALAPPTILFDLFDGEKRKEPDWTEED